MQRADKRRKSSGLRHKLQLEDIPEDNSPKPEVDDNEEEVDDDEDDEDPQSTEQLTRDYGMVNVVIQNIWANIKIGCLMHAERRVVAPFEDTLAVWLEPIAA